MRLTLELLGPPQLQLDNVPVTTSRRAVTALLAYLAVSEVNHPRRRHTRDSLSALLWPNYDQSKALANLRHILWEVTKFVGDGWIVTEHETVYLKPNADITLDVAQFRSLLDQAFQQSDPALRIPLLVEASKLYRDDFMSGFSLKDGSNINEWVLAEAESLRRDFASALKMLVEDYEALNQAQSAILYAQSLIWLDPINEAAHRQLMQLYVLTDQHTAAIQQYQIVEKLLRKELNVDPQPETRELYKKIRKGEFKTIPLEKKTAYPETNLPRHNLPVHLTTFIGREKEQDEISRLIALNRLVTLIGPGGIGKTRLSLQTGQDLLNHYPNGVLFVPLESLTDEELVPQTIASLFGIVELPGQTILETMVNELGKKTLLLILDNCEHLLDACAQVAETLLKNCPNLKILATSRSILRLEGEASYYVPPLSIPQSHVTQSMEELASNEAVQLFAQRAGLVVSSFKITKENIGTIVKICNRLDGIPLAIELAAARVDIYKVEEILKQLHRSFDLLISHTRSVLPRHQTMRTSIDWGWNLLTELERVFIRQLSVFIGGWTLQAAQAIGVGHSHELTSTLVKKSFVIVYQQMETETRYAFHEVVRSYAQEKLVEADEEETMRDRHLEYFLELSRKLEPALHGVDQDLWLGRLFVERDNIRAALEWAARTNVQAGLYLSNRLRTFWESYELREEARWLLMI
jgi:predicted ATPase/DNA-binding SARP family transcriptional activator